MIYFSGLLICPFFLCSQTVSFLLYIPFIDVFTFYLGTSVHIQQADIVLLQCAVIMFLFYLDSTHRCLASPLYIHQQCYKSHHDRYVSTVCICTF